ncbi:hypothetical protein ACOQFV_30830 [Nocardiopsis changdeensis]|uniref:Uncharacterized protein n=1 Tax=Nocardiopsis changdeensis TaxID=2831969 RepID=A0ABX8BTQ0_9ACTN|nr:MULTISPECIES: hypothetical protein [Nocardiopsis]QUX24133.1 hypothetical protein KGD84_07435 [Nocardiopsis changdeensis]QYX34528.1 hypothetical protein K1J57_16895 [Nocardiopsis sp. MT53]
MIAADATEPFSSFFSELKDQNSAGGLAGPLRAATQAARNVPLFVLGDRVFARCAELAAPLERAKHHSHHRPRSGPGRGGWRV